LVPIFFGCLVLAFLVSHLAAFLGVSSGIGHRSVWSSVGMGWSRYGLELVWVGVGMVYENGVERVTV
jgi:hypothetical protein